MAEWISDLVVQDISDTIEIRKPTRLSGLSEDTAEQCQRVRHDGVGTVIGEEMCRAVDDVAGEVVRLAAVDIEHARPDAGISAAHERDVGTVSRFLRYDVEARKRPISGRMRFRYSAEPASGCPSAWRASGEHRQVLIGDRVGRAGGPGQQVGGEPVGA